MDAGVAASSFPSLERSRRTLRSMIPRWRQEWTETGLVVALLVLIAAVGVLVLHVNGPRTVAEAVAPDGTEMRLVQRCNWSGEPFTTGFYFRRPGENWGWFYYDHQDNYWSRRSSRVTLDTNAGIALFYRDGVPAVTYDWKRERFILHRWRRVTVGAQAWLRPDQVPGER